MRRRAGRSRRAAPAIAAAIGLLLAGLGVVPLGSAATPRATPALGPAPPGAPAGTVAPFAQRAGFAAWQGDGTIDASAATNPEPVDVVFEPTARAALVAPAAGPAAPGAYAAADGLTPAAYSAAEQYFEGAGLSVTHAWPDRLSVSLRGTPAEIDRAFGTVLMAGTYDGRSVVYPSTPPSLPPALENETAGVVGLTSGYAPFSIALTPATAPTAAAPITPGEVRTMYNLSRLYNLTGARDYPDHEAIALVLWGDGYDPNDIATFFSDYYPPTSTFPAPTVIPYPVDGAPAPSPAALGAKDLLDVEELTLDLEWSGSMAPGATLDAVYTSGPSNANLTDAFEEALSLPNVTAISMSFGAPEASDTSLIQSWSPLLQEAADRGITVLAATGDTGGDLNTSCAGGPAPEYPASSPEVLAVGGTAVTVDRDPLGTITGFSQSGWSGSGGGFSTKFSAPGWQKVGSAAVAIRAGGGGRGTPDVSGSAVDNFLYFDNAQQEADGTSFASPIWAGLVAALDAHLPHPLGFFTDRLYHLTANQSAVPSEDGITDIASGANCVASASSGWDAVTGWGTPWSVALYVELSGSFVGLVVRDRPTTVAPGGSITVLARVTNGTTGAPLAGIPVNLTLAADTNVGPCTGSFGTVALPTNATGWVSASFAVPACYLGSHAIAAAGVITPKLFGHEATRIAVNLLGFVPSLEFLGVFPYNVGLFGGIVAVAVTLGGWLGRRPPAVPPPTLPPGAAAPTPPVSTPPAPGSGAAPPPREGGAP